MLLGVIPGPKEPELLVNSFLQPIVDQLKQLWNGLTMCTSSGIPAIVYSACSPSLCRL